MPVAPLSSYALTKYAGERYCQVFYALYGLETLALRYFIVLGPNQDSTSQTSAVIHKFIKMIKEGKRPVIYGDGAQIRDFTYVSSNVEANLLACTAPNVTVEVFKIACGERYIMLELVHSINEILGTNVEPIFQSPRPGDVKHSLADIQKAQKLLGFEVKVKFNEGLEKRLKKYLIKFNMFKDKVLLITGGTGSFGNAVFHRFINTDIREIRIFSRDEKKQDDLRKRLNNPKVKFYIGDVRSLDAVDMATKGVDYIFHAAALKQVPSCEFFPLEAVKTNIIGTDNVLAAAERNNVKRVVVLSTDKAVYPINAMGMSKAVMEKVMIARSRNLNGSGMVFCGTRYGNVMASRGSVIPLFIEQIKSQRPLTITDPNMTRFMMTLEDAVDLVLYAFQHGNNGDIFVQKAPAATIETLAKALLELYNANNEIRIIGTRHGEKLYETLITSEDMVKAEDMGDYYRIPADTRDLNYERYFSEGVPDVSRVEEYHSHNTTRLDVEGMKNLLLKLPIIRKEILGDMEAIQYPD
jgi:UDP-glucose 4-epimerase